MNRQLEKIMEMTLPHEPQPLKPSTRVKRGGTTRGIGRPGHDSCFFIDPTLPLLAIKLTLT